MKKVLLFIMSSIVFLTACSNTSKETNATAQPATTAIATAPSTQPSTVLPATQPQITSPVSTEAPHKETRTTEQTRVKEQAQEEQNMTLQMTIGNTPVSVDWEDNDAVQSLKELCQNQPLRISMSMYGGFEQVGTLDTYLPQNDVQTTTSAGDIVLYSGNQLVVFYGSNSWAYTRLGHITNQSANGMEQLLSNGDTTLTINFE